MSNQSLPSSDRNALLTGATALAIVIAVYVRVRTSATPSRQNYKAKLTQSRVQRIQDGVIARVRSLSADLSSRWVEGCPSGVGSRANAHGGDTAMGCSTDDVSRESRKSSDRNHFWGARPVEQSSSKGRTLHLLIMAVYVKVMTVLAKPLGPTT